MQPQTDVKIHFVVTSIRTSGHKFFKDNDYIFINILLF